MSSGSVEVGHLSSRRLRGVALVAVTAALYFGVGVFDHDVWAPTEPAVNGVVWEMYRNDCIALPQIDGMPYLEKPPLYYWFALGACKAAGCLSPGFVRLPAALLGAGCLVLVYVTSRRRHGAEVALVMTLLAATSLSLYEISHRASTDAAAVFFAFACFALFLNSIRKRASDPPGARFEDVIFAVVLSLSFYCKNLYVMFVVVPPVVVFLVFTRQFRRLAFLGAMLTVLTAAFILPWCIALHGLGGWRPLEVVFVENTIGRFLRLADPDAIRLPNVLEDALFAEKGKPIWFYLSALGEILLPWTLVFVAAVWAFFRKRVRGDDAALFLKISLVTIPAVLTVSAAKATEYLLPILFVLFMMTGDMLSDISSGARASSLLERVLLRAGIAIGSLIPLAVPVAMAVLGGDSRWLWLSLPALAVTVPLAARVWTRLSEPPRFATFLLWIAASYTVGLLICVPILDRAKGHRYYHDRIRAETAGCALSTTICDDCHLPLLNFYLDRRIPILSGWREVSDRLTRGEGEAIVVSGKLYSEHEKEWRGFHRMTMKPPGKRWSFVLLKSAAHAPGAEGP